MPRFFAAPPSLAREWDDGPVDTLSQALRAVHVESAIFIRVECVAPWGFTVPDSALAAELLSPASERLVHYHLVTHGKALVRMGDEPEVQVGEGDVVVLPHGDAHTVCNGSPARLLDPRSALRDEASSGRPRIVQIGEGGDGAEITHIVCAFFGCDAAADRLFLAGLPPVFKVNLRTDAGGLWLERTVKHLCSEGEAAQPGAQALLAKTAEALLIEALRRHGSGLGSHARCWMAGARDPIVGNALGWLHRYPGRGWTVQKLAAEVGTSRSVLGQRFSHFVGTAPMSYLMHLRLQLAKQQLQQTQRTVQAIGQDVGYQSEASFSRAFSRTFGVPPARWRNRRAVDRSGS
jgi:AraC-like DNA-binding protein